MKSKLLILVAAILLVGTEAKSQDDEFSIGIRVGVDLQNFNGKDFEDDKLEMNLVPKFHAGIVADIPLVPDFYIQPGLFFKTKGSKSDNEFLGVVDMTAKYNLSYLEVPISLLFKPQLGNMHIFLGFGPYVSYGIGGKAKFEVENVTTEANIDFEKDYESVSPVQWRYFKPFDFGGNIFFGVEMESGFTLQLNAQLGLAKINSDNNAYPDNDAEFRNTGFGLSVGYNF